MTKLLSLVLAALMLVGMLPLGVWAAGETHTVRFNLNYNGAPKLSDQKVADGEYATQPEGVIREGWHFAYWYVKLGDNKVETFDLAATPITKDVTLYARWTEDTLSRAEKMAQGLELAKRMEEKEEEPEEPEKPSYEEIIRKQEEELAKIKDLNNGELPEISLDEEDYIPSAIIGTYSDEIVRDYSTAIESLKDIAALMGFTDVEKEFKGETTHTFKNTIQYRLQQVYEGAEVYGKQLIVTTDENGKVTALTGNYDPIYNIIDKTIAVEEAEAYTVIAKEGIDCVDEDGGELVVYSLDGYNEYAWLFVGTDTVLVSAVDGSVLLHFTNFVATKPQDNWEPTIGRTNENPPRTFNTAYDPDEKTYVFYDSVRNILYHDRNRKTSKGSQNYFPLKPLKDNDNIWTSDSSKMAVNLYYYLSDAYDYYLETIGLLSYDGNGGFIEAFVNDGFENAFSIPNSLFGSNILTFGYTTIHVEESEPLYDLVGHEYTHSVQWGLIPSLSYHNETGALMEGYADIGGELIELFYNDPDEITTLWIHTWERNISLQVMDTRTLAIFPFKYKGTGYLTDNFDNGQVHHNSTVLSHAIYNIYTLGINDITELTELLYRTWSYLHSTAGFYDYRMAILAAAKDMKLSTEKMRAINTAFDAANVYPPKYIDYTANVSVSFHVTDENGRAVSTAQIQVKPITIGDVSFIGDVSTSSYTDSDGNCTLYLRPGRYLFIVSATGYKTRNISYTLSDTQAKNLNVILPDASNQPDEIKCELGGVVSDALTGNPIAGVTMKFRKGYNVTSGRTVLTLTTWTDGAYYTDRLEYGYYTVQLEKDGYKTEYVILQAAATNWAESIREDALHQNIKMQPLQTNPLIPEDAVYFNGSYYKVFSVTSGAMGSEAWKEAKAYCDSLDGHLAVISNQEENDFLVSYLRQLNLSNAYFGYTDEAEEGKWVWVDCDEKSTFENWVPGEPNFSDENYAMFCLGYGGEYGKGKWNNGRFGSVWVAEPLDYICEWNIK